MTVRSLTWWVYARELYLFRRRKLGEKHWSRLDFVLVGFVFVVYVCTDVGGVLVVVGDCISHNFNGCVWIC